MKKFNEREVPNSCWNKAKDDEMLFVLLERDPAAPYAIRAWIERRIELGMNHANDEQILNAKACARFMEAPSDSE